jgi:hypothetical protein
MIKYSLVDLMVLWTLVIVGLVFCEDLGWFALGMLGPHVITDLRETFPILNYRLW